MKKVAVLTAFLVLMGLSAAANAVPTYWTVSTIDAFDNYNVLYSGTRAMVENFNDGQLNLPGLSITAFGTDQTLMQNGYYQNVVDESTNSYQVVGYNYMHGFGGWFDLANVNGQGCSIDVVINGTTVLNIPNTATGQFFGVFSDTPFNSVTLQEPGISITQEAYQIVDLAICPQVPLPPSVLLLGSGLLGVGLLRFRRKNDA